MTIRAPKLTPNPGSDEAAKLGCTCPMIDNHHGLGAHGEGNQFWIADDCPLHGENASRADLNLEAPHE